MNNDECKSNTYYFIQQTNIQLKKYPPENIFYCFAGDNNHFGRQLPALLL